MSLGLLALLGVGAIWYFTRSPRSNPIRLSAPSERLQEELGVIKEEIELLEAEADASEEDED